MKNQWLQDLSSSLEQIKSEGLYKAERSLSSPQSVEVSVESVSGHQESSTLLNFCANNYLGYADHPRLKDAAKQAIDEYGVGMASVRFICGTQSIHRALERELADFLSVDDVVLFSSCYDANGGIFEVFLTPQDAVISDSLNHASIIDGIRLCKAQRFCYQNNDMAELEKQLQASQDCRYRLIVTDGVFSMDGILANLPKICDLAEEYDAQIMVDDSHAVGFLGASGAGTPDFYGVSDRIDILTGTFGKALGGAAGGYIAGPQPMIDMLRQKARPYLFSNALPPAIVAVTREAIAMVKEGDRDRQRLRENADFFRASLAAAGFVLAGADHAIIPVMLGDAVLAQNFAQALLEKGIYVTAFSYPVVPQGMARIRTQISSIHSKSDIERAVKAFVEVGRSLSVL